MNIHMFVPVVLGGRLLVESSIIVVHGTHEFQICSILGRVGTPLKCVIYLQLANMFYETHSIGITFTPK